MRLAWCLGGFLAGVAVSATASETTMTAPPDRRAALYGVLDTVFARYVEPLDADRVLGPAIQRLVGDLDPHSYYLTPEQRGRAEHIRRAPGDVGLHVRLAVRGSGQKHLEILGVREGSAAWAAGVRPGDHVVRIGPRGPESFLNQADVDLALAGLPGERRHLWILPQGDEDPLSLELDLEARRADRDVHARLLRQRGAAVLHLTISSFVPGVGERVRKLVHDRGLEAGPDGFAGIVLDVRGNPGGVVDEALVVADLFIADGVLTRTRGRAGKVLREERAHVAGTDTSTPLVLLQDRNSGSAAELLAAALQDHRRARIIGEQSYGKGTVQDVVGLADGSVLTLTIARYFSPNDRSIDGVGVQPDIGVAAVPDGREDPALARGLAEIPSRPSP